VVAILEKVIGTKVADVVVLGLGVGPVGKSHFTIQLHDSSWSVNSQGCESQIVWENAIRDRVAVAHRPRAAVEALHHAVTCEY
jgi:hypothetical protein